MSRAAGTAASRPESPSIRRWCGQRRPLRPAFTLLEVILSLALSVLLLGSLTWAIQLNLKATTSGRNDVERAQLARAALDRMAADIRGAVWYDPIDPNSLVVPPASSSQTSASSSSALPGSSGSGSGSGGSGGGTSSGGVASATKAESAESAETATSAVRASSATQASSVSTAGGGSSGGGSSGGSRGSSGGSSTGGSSSMGGGSSASGSSGNTTTETATTQLPPPCLYGGANWLQVDVSRLPRLDQYMISPAASPNAMVNRPSEIKSVFYYLAGSGQALPPALANAMAGGDNQGLMRREADRLTTVWQTSGGGGQVGTGQAAEALAPEVQQLEFRYFNGATYSTSWDSYAYGCLPRAIEIRMTLADIPASGPNAASSATRTLAQQNQPGNPAEYRIVVPIPAWKPPPLETTTSTSSTSGSSNSGATNISGSGSF